jgi:hypothetical protein
MRLLPLPTGSRVPSRRSAILLTVAVLASCAAGAVGTRDGAQASPDPLPGSSPVRAAAADATAGAPKRVCLYDANDISGLATFAAMVGRRTIDCAMVYTGSPDWAGWVDPWFLHHPDPDLNWAAWVRNSPANDRRQLIISQPLIPSGLASTAWRRQGAAGRFEHYARRFAQNLVAGGVGDAIIRLSWEMNGTWNVDNIGTTSQDMTNWIAFWRHTVQAMRAVPGAHFKFVWCINNRYRNIPFADYYPGDDVVDIIGDDVYDSGVASGTSFAARWSAVGSSPGGLQDLIAFAGAHGKPIAIPEWGVGVPNSSNLAGGDDPAYVQGIAAVVADNDVAFQTYFYAHEWATQLQTGPLSLAAYQAAFGDRGYGVGYEGGTAPADQSSTPAAPSPGATATPVGPPSLGAGRPLRRRPRTPGKGIRHRKHRHHTRRRTHTSRNRPQPRARRHS